MQTGSVNQSIYRYLSNELDVFHKVRLLRKYSTFNLNTQEVLLDTMSDNFK
jgi:hypothetical protein